MILPKHIFFQNIKIKSNSRTWMTLKSLIEIFQTLEPQRPQWPLQPQQPQWPQWPQQPHFTKIFIQLDVGPSLVPKWPVPVPFYGMDYRKFNFSLIFDTLSVGGCWGQPMLLFWKLVDETQISKPPEPTRHHNSIKLWILQSLGADLLYILQYETPCMTITGLFQCDSWCLPTQNWLKTPLMTSQCRNFIKVMPNYKLH